MRVSVIGCLLLILMLLTGCWDRIEVNDVAFVMGSAIDKEGDKYRATIQIALPGQLGGSKGGGGGTSGKEGWYIDSRTAKTVRQANSLQQKGISRRLNFSHRRTILVGEELAREGIEPIMDVLARIPQNRLTSLVIVSRGPAVHVLGTKTSIEMFSSESLRELAIVSMKVPRTLKNTINVMLMEGVDLVLPAVNVTKTNTAQGVKSQQTIRMDGIAVFSDNKLAGFLDGEEADGVLWAMGQAKEPEVSIQAPDGSGEITAQFLHYRTILEPRIQGDTISFRIIVHAIGTILENESKYELSNHSHIEAFEAKMKQKIEKDIKSGIQKMQKLKSDGVGFGRMLHTKRPAVWKAYKSKWRQLYPEISIEAHAEVDIENIGSVTKPFARKEKEIK
ncbi:Ger(x)C family spore germination protein [Paenibacillus nanensis]|uniref:Ger(X)C family spore germination protein n=1 Tax=Paenibacillus nanensis TaxID=393251 RepID=A0A3A1UP43_9BACL|nr:Ger(x)C family spore germination protein [Paenibacillus nanensis]RIX50328.1 Ger(x)C family spore germination protein [Paenibacillus nanensis]